MSETSSSCAHTALLEDSKVLMRIKLLGFSPIDNLINNLVNNFPANHLFILLVRDPILQIPYHIDEAGSEGEFQYVVLEEEHVGVAAFLVPHVEEPVDGEDAVGGHENLGVRTKYDDELNGAYVFLAAVQQRHYDAEIHEVGVGKEEVAFLAVTETAPSLSDTGGE